MMGKKIAQVPPGLDVYQAMAEWSEVDRGLFMARMADEGARKGWSPTMAYSYWGAPVGWESDVRDKYSQLANAVRKRDS